MDKKQVIRCSSQDEMMKTANRMIGEGYIVKTVVRITPFHLYGLCVAEYNVVIMDESIYGKKTECPGFLKKILRRRTWRSDLHKTSALLESSAL